MEYSKESSDEDEINSGIFNVRDISKDPVDMGVIDIPQVPSAQQSYASIPLSDVREIDKDVQYSSDEMHSLSNDPTCDAITDNHCQPLKQHLSKHAVNEQSCSAQKWGHSDFHQPMQHLRSQQHVELSHEHQVGNNQPEESNVSSSGNVSTTSEVTAAPCQVDSENNSNPLPESNSKKPKQCIDADNYDLFIYGNQLGDGSGREAFLPQDVSYYQKLPDLSWPSRVR